MPKSDKRKLDKSTLALTFKFDSDRFLRLRLATEAERDSLGVTSEKYKRPGIELIRAAGRRWEADKYQDLVDVAGKDDVECRLETEVNELVGRATFAKVENLFEILQRDVPPLAIIEGEFQVPVSMTPSLQEAYDKYGLETVKARPDIMWIRPYPTGAPLMARSSTDVPEYEIHIIDVKMAAEPSLRHFTEVTYYALGLAAALEEQDLTGRYAVSKEGFIWPGSHDVNEFRNKFKDAEAKRLADPLTKAFSKTLIPVPYEVYEIHVRQFFEDRLLRVLPLAPLEAKCHVSPKCQLCDYILFCKEKAEEEDQLSRIPWLNQGQADLLVSRGITKTAELAEAIRADSPAWRSAESASHQLRAEKVALLARADALLTGEVRTAEGRRCTFMPRWSDLNIYLTVHFDPGSGITFSMGASRVYFPPGRAKGDPPITDTEVFVVERVNQMNPETERARLIEFVSVVIGWLKEVSDYNEGVPAREAKSAHIFFWDGQEIKQLRRMLERHMQDPQVVDLIELPVRLFPPDSQLPDPELFQSQPGTAVKEVFRLLVGLPIPHGYTLFDVANSFYPNTLKDGRPYKYWVPYGFSTYLSDQIPFERAYELWQDRVLLRHYSENPQKPGRLYFRKEIYEGILSTTKTRLDALEHIVWKLRTYHGDLLTLQKSGFSMTPPIQTRIPERARNLIAFEKLNRLSSQFENRQSRALPVEEREARFVSIRGLLPAVGSAYDECIREIRRTQQEYSGAPLIAFTFAPTSRDSRIREGEFLLALSNELPQLDLDVPWRLHLGLTFEEAEDLTSEEIARAHLDRLLKVTLVRLEPTEEPPFLILTPSDPELFQFAQEQGLLDLTRACVLDPLHQDFSSGRIAQALKLIGGDPPPQKRKRRRKENDALNV